MDGPLLLHLWVCYVFILAHQPFVFSAPIVHCIFTYIWMWMHCVHLCAQNIEWITRSAWINVFISSINLKKKPHTHLEHNWCRQGWLVLKEISRTSEAAFDSSTQDKNQTDQNKQWGSCCRFPALQGLLKRFIILDALATATKWCARLSFGR